jgi:hypothetical protein
VLLAASSKVASKSYCIPATSSEGELMIFNPETWPPEMLMVSSCHTVRSCKVKKEEMFTV